MSAEKHNGRFGEDRDVSHSLPQKERQHHNAEIDQGNEAILLRVDGGAEGASSLKLAKDGHVSLPPSLTGNAC